MIQRLIGITVHFNGSKPGRHLCITMDIAVHIAYAMPTMSKVSSAHACQLPGYEPKSLKAWALRDGSGGCVRKSHQTSMCRNGEGFVKVGSVKVPDTSIAALMNTSMSSTDCEQLCLRNCSCMAFSSLDIEREGVGCLTWYGELMDTTEYTEGREMYVRVDAIELERLIVALMENELEDGRKSAGLKFFDRGTIFAATRNFSPVNKLGQGGFGSVYKVIS
ncbi:unnamed protein product [Dovyalis caffra]|uniref:Apple domain-containing protein n=1 Tax=Dovyalis caffra TaxID=77055 RepID=A0AAV1SK48_9ROSI|nr:unnamed protein product [Dovyalis caffra]